MDIFTTTVTDVSLTVFRPDSPVSLMASNNDGIGHDVRAAIAYNRAEGADKVGSLGFCTGGSVSLWWAAESLVDSAVTCYRRDRIAARYENTA